MAMTVENIRDAARRLAYKFFVETNQTANFNLNDLAAAILSIDQTMDAQRNDLTAGLTIRQNFVDRLPEPFKSASTVQQKGMALALWAMKESGII